MISSALVLAAALGVGRVPIPEAVMRFPDVAWWPGGGLQQESNMLLDVRVKGGDALRTAGPGPQQLAARWFAGRLNAAERVSALMLGGTWRSAAMLPVWADALARGTPRERQAALVGMSWGIGSLPPPMRAWPTTDEGWGQVAAFAASLATATRGRTLVAVWVDSYLRAVGRPRRPGFAIDAPAAVCLDAIRELARAEDADEVFALWPLLASNDDRFNVFRTVEGMLAARLTDPVPQGRGHDPLAFSILGAARLDRFVEQLCRPADGRAMFAGSLAQLEKARPGRGTLGAALDGLNVEYPYIWPALVDLIEALGAPAVAFNRQDPLDPANRDAVARVSAHFPITAEPPWTSQRR